MTKETWELFKTAAKQLGYDTAEEGEKYPMVSFSDGYSGRGMFGKRTCSITMPDTDYLLAMAVVVGSNLKEVQALDIAEELRNLRTDSMGKGIVVY